MALVGTAERDTEVVRVAEKDESADGVETLDVVAVADPEVDVDAEVVECGDVPTVAVLV
jgi:hypothetical protein